MRAFRVQAGRPAFNKHDSGGKGSPHAAGAKELLKMKYHDRLIEGLADQIGHRPTDRKLLETARIKRAAEKLLRRQRNRQRVRQKPMV